MANWMGRMALRIFVVAFVVLLVTPEAGAWRRVRYTDDAVVARAEVIVIARLDPASIVKVEHDDSGVGGRAWHYTATLLVTDVLRGDGVGAELPIAIQYGLTPAVGGWPVRDIEPGRVDIVDTPGSTMVLAPALAHAERDNLWFLRKEDGEVGRPPTPTGLYSIIDPEDVQPLEELEPFLQILTSDPEASRLAFVDAHPDLAKRVQAYRDHLAIERIVQIADVAERGHQLLPYFEDDFWWDNRPVAWDALVACGPDSGVSPKLEEMFRNRPERQAAIIEIWNAHEYAGAVPYLVDAVNESTAFWRDREFPPAERTAETGQVTMLAVRAVAALARIGDPRGRDAVAAAYAYWNGRYPELAENCKAYLDAMAARIAEDNKVTVHPASGAAVGPSAAEVPFR